MDSRLPTATGGSAPRRPKPLLRQHLSTVWTILLVALASAAVLREYRAVAQAVPVLRQSAGLWLVSASALALSLHAGWIWLYHRLMYRVGHPASWVSATRAYSEATLAGAVSPWSTPAATVAFVRVAQRSGLRIDDALVAFGLINLLGLGSFLVFVIPVLAVLWLHQLVAPDFSSVLFTALVSIAVAGGFTWLVKRWERWIRRLPAWVPDRIDAFILRVRGHQLSRRDLVLPFVVALGIDVLSAAVLYTCVRAAGIHPDLLTVLVADSLGTLAIILSPGFSGTGLAELGMSGAMSTMGIPLVPAIAATLLARFFTLWLPAGFGLVSSVGDQTGVASRLVYRLPALYTGLSGVLAVLWVVLPRTQHHFNRIESISPFSFAAVTRTFALLAGFYLLFLSYNLWRRKRTAWIAAIAVLSGLTLVHLVKRHDEHYALFTAVNVAVLVWQRRWYRVRADIPTLRQGLTRFVLSLVAAVVYGVIGFYLSVHGQFGREFGLSEAIDATLRTYFNLGDSGLVPYTPHARWFLDSLRVMGVVSTTYAVFSLARPVVWRRTAHTHERERARALIEQYGDSSLDYFKYADDKLFYFSSNGRGVVSFGLAGGVALVLGDPVAASEADFASTLSEFLELCEINDWEPAFLQATPVHVSAYRAAGLGLIKIGEEAIVDLDRFSLQGGAMKDLRYLVRRLERDGYRVVFSPPPQTDETIGRLRVVSDEWLSLSGHRERRFTLGRFDEGYVRTSPIFAVESPHGEIVAFANIIPDGREGEATIDLMRRRREPYGVMEFLFVKMFFALKEQGYHSFSLGMAPLANVGVEPDAPFAERVLRQVYEHLNVLFSYRGLAAFKAKFRPLWEPRYLVYRSELALPKIGIAIVRLTE